MLSCRDLFMKGRGECSHDVLHLWRGREGLSLIVNFLWRGEKGCSLAVISSWKEGGGVHSCCNLLRE